MIIDYKDVSFSFKKKRRYKRFRRLRFVFAISIVIIFYFLFSIFQSYRKIEKTESLLLENKIEEALKTFKKVENTLFFRKTQKELIALIYLFKGDCFSASRIFDNLYAKGTFIKFEKFLNYFLDNAEYKKLRIYVDYLANKGKDVEFFKILYMTASFDYYRSSSLIDKISVNSLKRERKALKIVRKINTELKSGRINYIFDINGKAIAYYNLENEDTVSLIPGINFDKFNFYFKDGIKFYKLTIDIKIQKKLHKLFKKFFGTFLLFNLSDNSITAAYSKPFNQKTRGAVFSQEYEPASIVKVLTLFSYLKYPHNEIFPFFCKGNMRLDNRIFYDWKKHGNVKTYREALAVSCNIAFSKMAFSVGFSKISDTYKKFYFNTNGLNDLFLSFNTGKYKEKISNDFQLAKLSVGLKEIKITTFHAALISAIISQNGSIHSPYLVKNIKNVLKLGFYNHKPKIIKIDSDYSVFQKIKNAMIDVVENKKGTGHRSKVDFVKVALKTGTSGERKFGFNSVLIGFFPAENPQYAFAFRLERAGKAELTGANFLKDFLKSFYEH